MGVAGGSVTTLAYRQTPSYLFTCLTLLPLFVGLYYHPDGQNGAIALALCLYIIFLLRNARVFHKNSEQMLFLKENVLLDEKKLRMTQQTAAGNALYLDSILQSFTETALIATDTNFCIQYFNPKAEHILGLAQDSVLGKTIMEVYKLQGHDNPDMGRFHRIVKQVQETGICPSFTMEVGSAAIEIRISSIKDHAGKFGGFLLMASDITESKKVHDQLRKLSRAVEQSHRHCRRAKINLIVILRQLMSHEIRTPMNSIIGRTNLALDNELDEEMRSHLEMLPCRSILVPLRSCPLPKRQ